jgi:hypothetical protein
VKKLAVAKFIDAVFEAMLKAFTLPNKLPVTEALLSDALTKVNKPGVVKG